jgi:hypothetical protein
LKFTGDLKEPTASTVCSNEGGRKFLRHAVNFHKITLHHYPAEGNFLGRLSQNPHSVMYYLPQNLDIELRLVHADRFFQFASKALND